MLARLMQVGLNHFRANRPLGWGLRGGLALMVLLMGTGPLTSPVAAAAPVAAPLAAATPACAVQHVVVSGDTLSALGRRYGVTWQSIATANNIPNPNLIYVAQILCIPVGSGGPVITPTATITVTATPVVTATIAPQPTGTPLPPPPIVGIPTFSIVKVVRGQSVTIQAVNFPGNTRFDVTMGAFGSLGIGGTLVTSTVTSSSAFTATYAIPAAWANADRIAIRLQSPTTGYFSYNWFWNYNAP
jgi:LysM repeat protein